MILAITGVSSGIGKAMFKLALDQGHTCIGLTRRISKIQDSIRQHHNSILIEVDWANINDVIESVESQGIQKGAIDVLINNAATIVVKDLLSTGQDSLMIQFKTNAVLPFLLSKELLQSGLFTQGAHIVNVGSMAGYQDSVKFPGLGAYSASKAALACLTQSMASEWGDRLSVNCLCLGAVNTDMLKSAFPDYLAPISDVQMASYIISFAVSAPDLMSGQVIPVKKDDPK